MGLDTGEFDPRALCSTPVDYCTYCTGVSIILETRKTGREEKREKKRTGSLSWVTFERVLCSVLCKSWARATVRHGLRVVVTHLCITNVTRGRSARTGKDHCVDRVSQCSHSPTRPLPAWLRCRQEGALFHCLDCGAVRIQYCIRTLINWIQPISAWVSDSMACIVRTWQRRCWLG